MHKAADRAAVAVKAAVIVGAEAAPVVVTFADVAPTQAVPDAAQTWTVPVGVCASGGGGARSAPRTP